MEGSWIWRGFILVWIVVVIEWGSFLRVKFFSLENRSVLIVFVIEVRGGVGS